MDAKKVEQFVREAWAYELGAKAPVIKALEQFITYQNDSVEFDRDWAQRGEMDRAVEHLANSLEDLKTRWRGRCPTDDIVVSIYGGQDNPEYAPDGLRRAPLLLVEVPAIGRNDRTTALLYGHMDKQPGLDDNKWSPGLGPRRPVIKDHKLYGRGGADDGYAVFSAFSAIMALREQGTAHTRCFILIEAGEESGSPDLEHYLTKLKPHLGEVTLVVALDSGCEDWERLWTTTSLRGLCNGRLSVGVLTEGVHSGGASGVAPSSFRILRSLLSRLEDEATGVITPSELQADIPAQVREQAQAIADVLGAEVYEKQPFKPGVKPVGDDLAELILNRTWRSQLAIIGLDGLPPTEGAGNVMLPDVTAGLSFRLPPTLSSQAAADFIKAELEKDPPYQAQVSFEVSSHGQGWAAPAPAAWLAGAGAQASAEFFGQGPLSMGEGGSIPFMSLLGELFPQAQFFITGVLGPRANAHGPDEFLHLPTVQKVTMSVARVLFEHHKALRFGRN